MGHGYMEGSSFCMWLFGTVAESSTDGRKTARRLLQYAVEQVWDMPVLPDIAVKQRGKPWFPDHPDCHFNLSHSGPYAFCGLADVPIGVDIEATVPRKDALALYIMDSTELIRYYESHNKMDLLYTLWTLKESYVKCTGEGIFYPPQAAMKATVFDIGFGQDVKSNREGYSFKALSGKGWRAAVCVKGQTEIPRINWVLS